MRQNRRMGIVAGLDSAPDFTRIVVCDTDTGAVVRQGYAPHPVQGPDTGRSSDFDPQAWLLSLGEAASGGLLEGVQAIGVSAQAGALVPLDAQGGTVRPAMTGATSARRSRRPIWSTHSAGARRGRRPWAVCRAPRSR